MEDVHIYRSNFALFPWNFKFPWKNKEYIIYFHGSNQIPWKLDALQWAYTKLPWKAIKIKIYVLWEVVGARGLLEVVERLCFSISHIVYLWPMGGFLLPRNNCLLPWWK